MTFTVEPMLTLGGYEWYAWDDDWTILTQDGSWAAQWEHTVVVTDDGAEILDPPSPELTSCRDASRQRPRSGEIWRPNLRDSLDSRYGPSVDPVRNPYAPGAGQRPPELAGRDAELQAFDVVLERVGRGRVRSARSCSPGCAGWARPCCSTRCAGRPCAAAGAPASSRRVPDQPLRRPLAAALHLAVRELAHPHDDAVTQVLGVRQVVRAARGRGSAKPRDRWQPGIDVPAVIGRADSGDIEIDLVELFTDVAGLAADTGHGIAMFIDEMQDLGPGRRLGAVRGLPRAVAAGPAAGRRRRRPAARAGRAVGGEVVLRAAVPLRPHRPARARRRRRRAAGAGPRRGRRRSTTTRSPRCTRRPAATRTSCRPTARSRGTSRRARRSPPPTSPMAAPVAESELAVGFFGSRYERATPAEREYLRAMADVGAAEPPDEPVPTAAVAEALDRSPQSVSPARDALLKKGLIYSGQRGRIAFTVPHFGRYLRRAWRRERLTRCAEQPARTTRQHRRRRTASPRRCAPSATTRTTRQVRCTAGGARGSLDSPGRHRRDSRRRTGGSRLAIAAVPSTYRDARRSSRSGSCRDVRRQLTANLRSAAPIACETLVRAGARGTGSTC